MSVCIIFRYYNIYFLFDWYDNRVIKLVVSSPDRKKKLANHFSEQCWRSSRMCKSAAVKYCKSVQKGIGRVKSDIFYMYVLSSRFRNLFFFLKKKIKVDCREVLFRQVVTITSVFFKIFQILFLSRIHIGWSTWSMLWQFNSQSLWILHQILRKTIHFVLCRFNGAARSNCFRSIPLGII